MSSYIPLQISDEMINEILRNEKTMKTKQN